MLPTPRVSRMTCPFELLNFGTCKIEHELVALQLQLTFGLSNNPIGMVFEQFTLWIHHLRLKPYPESETSLCRRLRQRAQAVGQASAVGCQSPNPAWSLVRGYLLPNHPSSRRNNSAPMSLAAGKSPAMRPKSKSKPVASQLFNRTLRGYAVPHPKVPCPGMEFAAHFSQAPGTPGPDHDRGYETLLGLPIVGRREWITRRKVRAQPAHCARKRIENCPTRQANQPKRDHRFLSAGHPVRA